MNFKAVLKGISYTFAANLFSLAASLVSTLILPKIIEDVDFGYWQLYLLYISYAGLMHLGLCDGIYLRNGGKKYEELDAGLLKSQLVNLTVFLIFTASALIASAAAFSKDGYDRAVVQLVCVGAVLHVAKTFFLLILQTTNRLKEYSSIVIIDRIAFVAAVFLQYLMGRRDFVSVIYADIFGRGVSLLLSAVLCRNIIAAKTCTLKAATAELRQNIKAGLPLLISGLAGAFIIGIVRIGIEACWDIVTFGKVSLALSVANMFLSFITMVGIVFFPIIKRMDVRHYRNIFKALNILLVVFSLCFLIFAEPIKAVIGLWLPNYADFLQYMVYILPMCIFECESQILLATYLKALRKEIVIMEVNIVVMFLSILYTIIATKILGSLVVSVLGIVILLGLKTFITKLYLLKKLGSPITIYDFIEYIVIPIYLFVSYVLPGAKAFALYVAIVILLAAAYRKSIEEQIETLKSIGKG